MKRLIALFVAMLFAAAANADMLIPRVGIGLSGNADISGEGFTAIDQDTETGYSLGIDYLHPVSDMFALGAGVEYQMNRKIKDMDAEVGFTPVYVTGMFAPFKARSEQESINTVVPYAKVNLGYDIGYSGNDEFKFLNSSLNGGMYWAAGVGVKLPYNIMLDLTYSSFSGEHEVDVPLLGSVTSDDTFTNIGLNIGYAFDLNMMGGGTDSTMR
jgi:hypothetical protein